MVLLRLLFGCCCCPFPLEPPGPSSSRPPAPVPVPEVVVQTPAPVEVPRIEAAKGVHVDVVHKTYPIRGSTGEELRAAMSARGPETKDGRFDAETKWWVSWQYPYERRNGRCSTGPVTVDLDVVFKMPKWRKPEQVSPGLVAEWEAYVHALQQHENRHHNMGMGCANEMVRRLGAIEPQTSCKRLDAKADRIGDEVLSDWVEREKQMDADTQHGQAQGAHFY